MESWRKYPGTLEYSMYVMTGFGLRFCAAAPDRARAATAIDRRQLSMVSRCFLGSRPGRSLEELERGSDDQWED